MAKSFENWSGSIRFEPSRIENLSSEEAIVKCVTSARERGDTVRPVGSGHSSMPIFATDDVLAKVDDMAGVVDHDEDAGTATILPGTTLEDAGAALAKRGLAMENLGDVNYQTIAGAIGTGTHGTGITMGNLSSTLVGGRLVTGTGEVVPFGVDAGEEADDRLLRAAQVSLGSLGIMSSLTLRVIEEYDLHRRNWMTHVEWAKEHFDELVAEHRHFDFYWYPRSDEAQVRTMNEPGHEVKLVPPSVRRGADPDLKTEETGPSHEIITNDRDLRFDEMEYMFPLEGCMEIFEQVRQRVKERHRADVGWRVLVRTIAQDDAMISNCNAGPTMSIALLQNNELPHDDYFSDMEPLLLDLGGKPHWGKKHSLKADRLAALYPEWEEFQRVRRELDPDGVLLNDYLRELFEGEASDAGGAGAKGGS